jgi:hypothetical protein
MKEKIVVEQTYVTEFPPTLSVTLAFPEIERHLSEGWTIKQMFVSTCKDVSQIITVHLQHP